MNRKRHTTNHPNIWYRLTDESNPDSQRRYIVRYTDANGGEHTKTLPLGSTIEDAKVYQARLQSRKSDGDSLIPCRQTVGELLDEWLENRNHSLAVKTIESYQWAINKHLKTEFGNKRITELSPSDVARLISRLEREGKKAWTIRSVIKPLKGAYEVAVRDGKVTSSPVTKLLRHEKPKSDQKQMRCMSAGEIQLLISSCASPLWRALFSLMTYCGLRISEALALEWEDISETGISIRRSKTKAGVREVPLPKGVYRLLRTWKLKQPPGLNHVFSTHENGPCGYYEALRALRRAEKYIGLPNYTPHELRHTYASILISWGVDLPTVAEYMGHSNPAITFKTYAHLYDRESGRERVLDALDEEMGGVL